MGSTPIQHSVLNVKAVVAAFNQEKALVGAFSVITNLRMELFEALVETELAGIFLEAVSPAAARHNAMLQCHGQVSRRLQLPCPNCKCAAIVYRLIADARLRNSIHIMTMIYTINSV